MMEPAQVAESLRDALMDFGRDGERALTLLEELYDRDVLFRDPLQTLRGRDAFLAMNRRILGRARRLSFDVRDVLGGHDSLCLTWTMTYEMRRGPTLVFEGATHARVQGGAIIEQRDYWDLLSTVAESHSLLRHVYAALAPHLG